MSVERHDDTLSYVDDERPEVTEGWRIESLGEADWALERLAHHRREIAEALELEKLAIQRIRERTAKLTAEAQRGVRFFEGQLQAYAATNRHQLMGTMKSRKLTHGTLGWRTKPEGHVVTDEAALLEWCRKQPLEADVLRIKEEPALAVIWAHIKRTGEDVPGTAPEPATEVFYVKES